MLKTEDNNVLDALDWDRERVPRKAFTDDDLDAPDIIDGVPVVLAENLFAELWKPESFVFTRLVELYQAKSIYGQWQVNWGWSLTKGVADKMRAIDFTVEGRGSSLESAGIVLFLQRRRGLTQPDVRRSGPGPQT